MLQRLRSFLNNPQAVEAAGKANGRRRPFVNRYGANKRNEQQFWQQQPAQAAPAATQPPNRAKYFRYALMAFGSGYIAMRMFGRSDPVGNVLGSPAAARAKLVLNVEKLDDKIANYQTTYAAASQGIRNALIYQARNITFQRIGLQVRTFVIYVFSLE